MPGLRGACPCCGAEVPRLRPCPGCPWATMPGRTESRQRLAELRPDSARHAFNPIGCLVCDACRTQMTQHPPMCPLRIFYDVTHLSTSIDGGGWPTSDQRPTTDDRRPTTDEPPPVDRNLDLGAFYTAWWAERSGEEGGGLLVENAAAVEKIVRQWFYWLAQRGWPEETEALWSRMLAFLREEEDDSTENR